MKENLTKIFITLFVGSFGISLVGYILWSEVLAKVGVFGMMSLTILLIIGLVVRLWTCD